MDQLLSRNFSDHEKNPKKKKGKLLPIALDYVWQNRAEHPIAVIAKMDI